MSLWDPSGRLVPVCFLSQELHLNTGSQSQFVFSINLKQTLLKLSLFFFKSMLKVSCLFILLKKNTISNIGLFFFLVSLYLSYSILACLIMFSLFLPDYLIWFISCLFSGLFTYRCHWPRFDWRPYGCLRTSRSLSSPSRRTRTPSRARRCSPACCCLSSRVNQTLKVMFFQTILRGFQ